nr:hypothetical protein BDOA9_0107760 [Bradyrhizobium sp. DOA9]
MKDRALEFESLSPRPSIAMPASGGRLTRASYFRSLALAPATICMATPAIQPTRTSQVQAMCGSSRSTITATEAKAVSVAQSVPAALMSSAASIWLCASSKGICGVSMPR